MNVSKTRFINWTRCPMYFPMDLKFNPTGKADINDERERREERLAELREGVKSSDGFDAEDEEFDAQPGPELEALLPYYNKVEEEALKVATTIKLTRALWIIPLALFTSVAFNRKGGKISIPWFIFFFVLAMVVNTYVLSASEIGMAVGHFVNSLARKSLTLTLFFIGASLSRGVLKAVGLKPMVQGVLLWVVISVSTLAYIFCFD